MPNFPVAAVMGAATCLAVSALAEPFVGAHGALMPATYTGTDEDKDWHVDLWPDQSFHLRKTAPDGDTEGFAGRWYVDAEAGALMLPLHDATLPLVVRNAERLRRVGAPEDGSGDLVTQGALDPASISLPAAGMFTYFADAPTFVHCATDRQHPVAQEKDYLALETAYLEDRAGPAEPLFVTLDATIAMRDQMEGPARLTVTAERFGATWPGETCARADARPTLAGTVWRLRSIGGQNLAWSPPQREPYLVLRRGEGRFNASVGCNTMMGGFSAEGSKLAFTQPASTMMACPGALAGWEARLTSALGATRAHAIGGGTLRLLDAEGAILAEFGSAYQR